ncbi:MAG: MFS transporter [Psychroflexus halocasei]|uniref:MFS transporter n=1 Tax=Psychroflexus sp. S27 TaxID=1982757 RepID=UPI00192D0671|nr:MFS transporter [Psychroflexus sp. S27]
MKNNYTKQLFGTDTRVIILGIARMADAVGNSFLVVVLPLYIASGQVKGDLFGLSESLITGIVIGLFGLVSSFCQPLTGRLSDKLGKRKFFVILGLFLFMIVNFLYSFAHSYLFLLLIRAAQGIAAALTITATLALVSEVSSEKNRGGNMGVYNAFRLIGFGIGPLVSGVLVESGPYTLPVIGTISGFIAAFLIAALAPLISLILVSFFVKDPEDTKPSSEGIIINFKSKIPGKIIDPIFTLGIATMFMSMGFALLAPIELEVNERLSQGPFLFSIQFSALIASLAIFQPIIGKASDKYGRKVFIVTGLICLIPIVLFEGMSTESWHMIVSRALHGISAAMVFAPALALAGDLAKKGQVGAQLSVLTVAFGLGISLGAFLTGFAIRFGFAVPFIIGSVLAGIGAILVYTQVPSRHKNVE